MLGVSRKRYYLYVGYDFMRFDGDQAGNNGTNVDSARVLLYIAKLPAAMVGWWWTHHVDADRRCDVRGGYQGGC